MNTEHRERRLELSTTQITGSALAAMSGAFFASWAGTTGTIVGAALGSVIVTVGAATYTWSLQRTRDAVKRTAAQVRQSALTSNAVPRTVSEGPMRTTDRRDDQFTAADRTAVLAAIETGPRSAAQAERPPRSLPWGKLVLTSVAVTALGLGGITAIEAVTGKPVSSYTGSSGSTGTTLGNAVGSSGTKATQVDPTTQSTSEDSGSTSGSTGSGTGDTKPTTPTTPTPSTDPTPTPTPTPTPDPVTDPVTPTPDPEPSPGAG